MTKVLRIINRLNLGGPTYNVAFLTKYLEPEFKTILVSGMIDETEESSEYIARELGLEPIYIPEMYRDINLIQDRNAYRKIKNIIREFKPDIVHTHAAKAGTLGRLAAINCNVPVILHTFHGHVFHSYFGPFKTRMFLEIERYLAARTTRIIAISERQKKELGLIYKVAPFEKIEVIPLRFNLDPFQENQEEKRKKFRYFYLVDEDEIVVAIIGRLVPVKNHRLFIDAMKIVFDNTKKKVRAFIVGDGEERTNIENYIASCRIEYVNFTEEKRKAKITFTSWRKDIDVVIAGSDIIALCSFNEGTPVSLIEAQAANKPIVTTRVGGITDVVIPEITALISSKKSVANFARNLFMIIEDDERRKNMGKSGHEFVAKKFSYTRLIHDTAELYNKLLKEKSK